MAKRIGQARRKTRHKLSKSASTKGKMSLTSYFQTFKVDDTVTLMAEPSIQKGIYCLRYYGKTGIVKGKQGRCYEIAIKDRSKPKTLIVHPVHLKKL